MASSQGNRATFISGLMRFMSTYGFDGVDLDWEYPGGDDRGGKDGDGANFAALVKEMKAAFGGKYGITVTLPTSYWYLQHFSLPDMMPHVDWFNLMSYDLHGTWDAASKFVGPYVATHTNITEIDLGLDLLWRAGVTPDKVVLGQGWYGRSFTLADPGCNVPNGVCKFSGPANAGPCSNAAGILDNREIFDIIQSKGLKPSWDHTAGVKWINWDGNQWVSYDDTDTFAQKRDFANKRCLSGLMVWAMDQVDQGVSQGLGQAAGVTPSQQSNAAQSSSDQQAKMTCRYADCGQKCPHGSNEVAESNGQPGQLSTVNGCPKGKYRPLCCDDGTTMGKCQWRGYRGAGLSCIGGCADGETEVATNKNSHTKKGDQTCNGGLQSYCCGGFKPAPSKAQLEADAKQAAEDAAKAAAEQAALDIAAKAFCRLAVPALLAPLELLEDLIPIIGEILDLAEIAATPALINLCVKGIEKEGKAEFKVFGKKYTLKPGDPTKAPESRPPQETHKPPKTSTKSEPSCSNGKRGLDKRVKDENCMGTTTEYTKTTTELTTIVKRCVGWHQACFHYSSAIDRNPEWQHQTCSSIVEDRARFDLPATRVWSQQHNVDWRQWMERPQELCERDEWPPAYFWGGGPGQMIRYNHKEDNGGAGSLWKGFCDADGRHGCVPGTEKVIKPARRGKDTLQCELDLRLKVMKIEFDFAGIDAAQLATFGLKENECYPRVLGADPGFALLNEDKYWSRRKPGVDPAWTGKVPDSLKGGKNPPFPKGGGNGKRSLPDIEMMNLAYDNGTFSQAPAPEVVEARATEIEEEMMRRRLEEEMEFFNPLGYVQCRGSECATQVTPVGSFYRASLSINSASRTAPATVEATVTRTASLAAPTFRPAEVS